MYIHVRVVPYAVPYLGQLRLQGAVSGSDNVRLEKTVSEEDFFTYTIKSDADLMKTIKINPQGGYDIDGNLGIHAALTQRFPESGYKYAIRLPSEQERMFANGVSVNSLKDMAVQKGLDPNDFVLQIGLDDGEGGSVFSEVYRDQARSQRKTTFLRIIDKRQKYYTLNASSNDLALGTVEPATLTVKAGGEATFTAKAKENAIFKGWKKGSAEVTVTESVLKLTNVQEASEWTAVFEKKASTPQVGPVEINFGQREALLTWAAGSATSWTVKVYQGEQVVFDQEIQTPQLVLVGLKPGENYRYEIVAKMSGKLPSQAVQGSFRTDQFDVNDLLSPHVKDFSKLQRNKSFPIIFLDVDPRDFPQGMTVEAYSVDERLEKSSLTLRKDGKIYWLTLPEGNAKTLVFLLKSGSGSSHELNYELSK